MKTLLLILLITLSSFFCAHGQIFDTGDLHLKFRGISENPKLNEFWIYGDTGTTWPLISEGLIYKWSAENGVGGKWIYGGEGNQSVIKVEVNPRKKLVRALVRSQNPIQGKSKFKIEIIELEQNSNEFKPIFTLFPENPVLSPLNFLSIEGDQVAILMRESKGNWSFVDYLMIYSLRNPDQPIYKYRINSFIGMCEYSIELHNNIIRIVALLSKQDQFPEIQIADFSIDGSLINRESIGLDYTPENFFKIRKTNKRIMEFYVGSSNMHQHLIVKKRFKIRLKEHPNISGYQILGGTKTRGGYYFVGSKIEGNNHHFHRPYLLLEAGRATSEKDRIENWQPRDVIAKGDELFIFGFDDTGALKILRMKQGDFN